MRQFIVVVNNSMTCVNGPCHMNLSIIDGPVHYGYISNRWRLQLHGISLLITDTSDAVTNLAMIDVAKHAGSSMRSHEPILNIDVLVLSSS